MKKISYGRKLCKDILENKNPTSKYHDNYCAPKYLDFIKNMICIKKESRRKKTNRTRRKKKIFQHIYKTPRKENPFFVRIIFSKKVKN